MKPTMQVHGTKLLKLTHDYLLSILLQFGFNLDLRHYSMVCGGVFKQAAFAATGRTLVHSVMDWCRNTATNRGAESSTVLSAVLASGSTPYRPKVGWCDLKQLRSMLKAPGLNA